MDKIFVVAGTRAQYDLYRRNKIEEMHAKGQIDFRYADIICVSSINALRGIRNPHGVFIGTWRERPDIVDIVETLVINSTNNNPELRRILSEVKLTKPKLRGIQNTGIIVDEYQDAIASAASLLAKEIDAQVLKQLMSKP